MHDNKLPLLSDDPQLSDFPIPSDLPAFNQSKEQAWNQPKIVPWTITVPDIINHILLTAPSLFLNGVIAKD